MGAEQTTRAHSDAINTEATMLDRRRHSKMTRLGGLLAVAMLALFAAPSLANGALLESFTAEVRDQNGDPFTQAGGHPFEAFTDIDFFTHDENGQEVPDESARTIQVDLPAGLVGNPQSVPQCTRDELTTGFGGGCPQNTQVGVTTLRTGLGLNVVAPVYNLEPPDGMPAQFGFIALIPPVYINASVRPDGGLRVTIPNTSQALPLTGTSLTFWGVPADPAHDADRGQCLFDPDQTVLSLEPTEGQRQLRMFISPGDADRVEVGTPAVIRFAGRADIDGHVVDVGQLPLTHDEMDTSIGSEALAHLLTDQPAAISVTVVADDADALPAPATASEAARFASVTLVLDSVHPISYVF